MKGLLAAALMALPIAGTALVSQPASADVVIRPVIRTAPVVRRAPVVGQAPRRVWVAGHWDYTRRNRVWVPGHYEYRR